ncbi:hypothetical protein [Thalassospira sp. TSL5-1]|uniref:hypothetical protein n=1 Tax=Thalassospira sp. TSL5-1 TaxID=1544451 RepID=UPI00093E3CBD|nr:hypothetical protein [Thalassospira sp. TSL5-1]
MIGSKSEYARHLGVSPAAVTKMVKTGKIPVRDDGRIDFADADFARRANGDPARAPSHSTNEPVENRSDNDASLFDLGEERDTSKQPDARSNPTYTDARTEREQYAAKLARLDYEQKMGNLLPKQEILDAMVASGRRIRQGLDSMIGWAEEIDAAARNGGSDAVRTVLKQKTRDLQTMIAESLSITDDDEQG